MQITEYRSPAIALRATPTDAPKWIQVAYEGAWSGHHMGPFQFTRQMFDTIVRNFRNHPQYTGRSDVVAFDFNHASEMHPTEGSIPSEGTPAQAWAQDLEVRTGPDGKAQLWALTRLLEPAKTYIRNGQMKWVSVAVWFDAVDPVTGKPIGPTLTSIAFTNNPFLQGLPAIAASSRPFSRGTPMIVKTLDQHSMRERASALASATRRYQCDGRTYDEAFRLAQLEVNELMGKVEVPTAVDGASVGAHAVHVRRAPGQRSTMTRAEHRAVDFSQYPGRNKTEQAMNAVRAQDKACGLTRSFDQVWADACRLLKTA